MDEIKMEREIKEMLHQCADELHAPDSMQARVKFALNNAPARKRHLWSKRFVAVAAVAAIAVTGAFAAGGMGGIFSEGWSDQRLDLSSTQAHLADAGVALTLPDKIGEYTFSYGSDVDTTAQNDMGETEKVSEVDATYTKDGAELNLSAHKSYTVFTEDEMENPVPATTAEVNGITLTYRDAHYRTTTRSPTRKSSRRRTANSLSAIMARTRWRIRCSSPCSGSRTAQRTSSAAMIPVWMHRPCSIWQLSL